MSPGVIQRRLVFLSVVALLGAWMAVHFGRLTGDQNGTIRFVLGVLFSVLILLRQKVAGDEWSLSAAVVPVLAVVGALLAVFGLVFRVNMAEWVGVLLLVFACLRWALPHTYTRDLFLALLLLFWVHPLPGQVFTPLQFGMQRLSVVFSEWLLQSLNARVWADGLLIYTGYRVFGVPEACSGMRTAVTVLLSALAIGILLRFRWYETVALLLLGLFQVLILNILRITLVVYFGADMPQEWSYNVLHGTLAVFLFFAVMIVGFEAMYWQRRRRKFLHAPGPNDEPDDKASMFPRVWTVFFRWCWLILFLVLLVGGIVAALYKCRPEHRAQMIAEVVDGLKTTNPEMAERAINEALQLEPDDADLQLERLRVLFLRGQYDVVLQELTAIPLDQRTVDHDMLRVQALNQLGRIDEAAALVENLPADLQAAPVIAAIRAEFAVKKDQADVVAANVVLAAKSPRLVARVRALYPYLASRERWSAIVRSDVRVPFENPVQALIAITACLKMGSVARAQEILTESLAKWPGSPLFVSSLQAMSEVRPGSEWETRFVDAIRATLSGMKTEDVAKHMEECFSLGHTDLGWVLYMRLATLDPHDPELHLAAARYSGTWLAVPARMLGVRAGTAADSIVDLGRFWPLTRHYEPWKSAWARVPFGRELSTGDPEDFRRLHTKLCYEEIERRRKAGPVPSRIERMLPLILAMGGQLGEAHQELSKLEQAHPDKRPELLLEHARLYEAEGEWENAYEALKSYMMSDEHPPVFVSIRAAEALLRLNMGACALGILEQAHDAYPEAVAVRSALVAVWSFYGFVEHALFLAVNEPQLQDSPMTARLLYDTGRFKEAARVASVARTTLPDAGSGEGQSFLLPPAQWSIQWMGKTNFTDADYAGDISKQESELAQAGQSPFIKSVHQLKLNWLRARGQGNVSNMQAWRDVGRDRFEQATALNELTILLAKQQRFEEAGRVAREVVKLMPESSIVWRIAIALTQGDPEIVAAARAARPADPEIWMADLCVQMKAHGPGDWVAKEMRRVSQSTVYPAGTVVRAGALFLHTNMVAEASAAARYAIDTGRDLLPAYVLGLQCALRAKDNEWAMKCATRGAELAVEPWAFLKVVVALKTATGSTDSDLVHALEQLSTEFPDELSWRLYLGDLYFQRGETDSAFGVLAETIQKGSRKPLPVRSYLLGAEAARLQGRMDKAAVILEQARTVYTNDLAVLNNLIYVLAQDPRTLPRARSLLPDLLEGAKESFAFYDTAAVVALRSGDAQKALEYSEKALNLMKKGSWGQTEVIMNAAEIQFALGQFDRAQKSLEQIRADVRRSAAVDVRARELLNRIAEETGGKKPQP